MSCTALFSKLSTSSVKLEGTSNFEKNSGSKSEKAKVGSGTGTFTWPSGAVYTGQFSGDQRNGKGVQTWQDGSSYDGEFLNDMRHGIGLHRWKSGEVYEGQFYKDHRHGKGIYTWPDGTKFIGMFYLDRKEGYGKFFFSNGDKFEGLYKMDERFGPGIFTYKDFLKGQDIGIWHRQKLLKICGPATKTFSMLNHPEYEYYPEEHHIKLNLSCNYDSEYHKVFVRESPSYTFLANDFKASLFAENTALPPGIESYTNNFEYLPLTYKHKEEFEKSFFGSSYEKVINNANLDITAMNSTPLLMEVEKHVLKHQYSDIPFDVKAIMNADRTSFQSRAGHLERMSQSLIDLAAEGNEKMVYSILKTSLVDPNVSDNKGNVALILAAINCHHNIVNLLLDMGANVNQLTDEGITALVACHVFYYPIDHFKPNVAESAIDEQRNFLNSKKTRKNSTTTKHPSKTNLPTAFGGSAKKADKKSKKARTPIPEEEHEEKSDAKDMNVEPHKSDFRILKARREKILRKDVDAFDTNLPTVEGNASHASTRIFTDQPPTVFSSGRNMVDYEVEVTEDLIHKTATLLSLNRQVVEGVSAKSDQILELGTPGALAVWKAEHSKLHSMIKLLLQRGANPNTGTVPFPALFFAVKAGDVEAVELLLEKGALTDHRLSDKMCLLSSPGEKVRFLGVSALAQIAWHSPPLQHCFVYCGGSCGEGPRQLVTSVKLLGYGMLHFAAGLRSPECVKITECLLKASADPNMTAVDEQLSFDSSLRRRKISEDQQSLGDGGTVSSNVSGAVSGTSTEETGRTPLHLACGRDDDYESCRDVARLLLHHGGNPDVNWSGHSPLTLAIASGNDLALDELLASGANPSMHLTRHVPTSLCASYNIKYENRRTLDGRLKLINKLTSHGADVLAPVQFGTKKLIGTVVDYAHWMFMSDKRIAHTPYHALTPEERETYTARRTLFSHIGDLLREAAVKTECQRLLEIYKDGSKNLAETSPSKPRRFLYSGTRPDLQAQLVENKKENVGRAAAQPNGTLEGQKPTIHLQTLPELSISKVSFEPANNLKNSAVGITSALDEERALKPIDIQETKRGSLKQLPIWKPLIRYCYDCGRSVGVRLTPCSRCHEVYYCSRACKLKAWEERHKDECLRIKVRTQSSVPSPSEVEAIFSDHKLDEVMERARVKTDSIVGALLDQHLLIAEEKQLAAKRLAVHGGSKSASRTTTAKSSMRYRNDSAATSRKTHSSKKSLKSSGSSRIGLRSKQNPAKVSRKTRLRVGKDVVFGTTGMTLAELGITENYSFE